MSKWVLVNSHRRSGTHFLIDSLLANLPAASFPGHAKLPVNFNVGSLFRKDPKVLEVFRKVLGQDQTVVIKSHLLPEEMKIAPQDEYEELIREIFDRSFKLYVHRDGRDALVSLYHFLHQNTQMKTGHFGTFLRSMNDHIAPTRSLSETDRSRPHYWSHHVTSWLERGDTHSVAFEDLKRDHSRTLTDVIIFLKEAQPDHVQMPAIPKNKLWHRVQQKMYNFGLLSRMSSTSVSPRSGLVGGATPYFNEQDEAFYLEEAAEAVALRGDLA